MLEIEKKYLIHTLPEKLSLFEKVQIRQGYISTSPVIRIRQQNQQYFLTCKGKGNISREEWELEISAEEFQELSKKVSGRVIEKERYFIPLEGDFMAELDIYHQELEGLYTVEVEFSSMEQAENFVPPLWFGEDVSLEKKYKNSNLSYMDTSKNLMLP